MGPVRDDAEIVFRRQFLHCHRDLCRFVHARSSNVDAEALVAEVFAIAWSKWERRPEAEREVRPWLFGIARNVVRGENRKRRQRPTANLEALYDSFASPAAIDRIDSDIALRSALAHLSEADRAILLLVGWEEFDIAELALTLQASRVAARVRLHRARRRLLEALGQQDPRSSPTKRSLPLEKGLEP